MRFSEFKEAKSHGTTDFPVEYYDVKEGAPNSIMPLHWHEELELVRVSRGELDLYINNEETVLGAGELAFIGSGMLHRAEPHSCDYECLVFSPSFLKKYSFGRISELLSPLISGDSVIDIGKGACQVIAKTAESLLLAAARGGEYRELAVASDLARLFYLLYDGGYVVPREQKRLTKGQERTMTTLIEWIEKNYTERITLARMAELCGLTPKYLCSFFKKMTGYTPTDYVNRLRIEKACLALSDGHTSITDAAFDNGFNELSYFSKLFKKYMNCTPREFRDGIIRG